MDNKQKLCFEFLSLGNILRRYVDNSNGIKYAEKYTGSNCWVLGFLFHNGDREIFQKDIEDAFSIRRSTVSRTIKLMEKKGLIKRESVDYDARLKKIVLTEKAMEINELIENDMRTMGEKFADNLTDEEVEQFSCIITKIRKNFE